MLEDVWMRVIIQFAQIDRHDGADEIELNIYVRKAQHPDQVYERKDLPLCPKTDVYSGTLSGTHGQLVSCLL